MKNKFMASALAFAIATPAIVMPMTVSAEQATPQAPQAKQTESERVFAISDSVNKRSAFMQDYAKLVSVEGIKDKVLTGEPIKLTVNIKGLPNPSRKYALMVVSQSGTSYTTSPVYGKDVIKGKGNYSITVPQEALNKKHSAFLTYSIVILNDKNEPTNLFNSIGTVSYFNNNYDEDGFTKGSNFYTPLTNGKETNATPNTQQKPVEKEVLPSTDGDEYGTAQNGLPQTGTSDGGKENQGKNVQQPNEGMGNNLLLEDKKEDSASKDVVSSTSDTEKTPPTKVEKEEVNTDGVEVGMVFINGKYVKEEDVEKEKEKMAKEEKEKQEQLAKEKEQEKIEKSGIKQLPYVIVGLLVLVGGFFGFRFIKKKQDDKNDVFK